MNRWDGSVREDSLYRRPDGSVYPAWSGPGRVTYLCVRDRYVTKSTGGSATCPTCREPMRSMGKRWRAPKRRDERAWRMVERGDYLWDRGYFGSRVYVSRGAGVVRMVRGVWRRVPG